MTPRFGSTVGRSIPGLSTQGFSAYLRRILPVSAGLSRLGRWISPFFYYSVRIFSFFFQKKLEVLSTHRPRPLFDGDFPAYLSRFRLGRWNPILSTHHRPASTQRRQYEQLLLRSSWRCRSRWSPDRCRSPYGPTPA